MPPVCSGACRFVFEPPIQGGNFVVCLVAFRTEEKVLEAPGNRFAVAVELLCGCI
jgi:hypothetical protein